MNSMVDLSSSLCKRLPFRVAVHDFETSKKTSPDRWIASPPTKRPEPLGLVLGGLVDLAFNWQFSFPRAPPMHIARYLLAGHRWETWETSDLVSARNFGLKKTVVPPVRKWSFFFFFSNSNGDLEGRPYFPLRVWPQLRSFVLCFFWDLKITVPSKMFQ